MKYGDYTYKNLDDSTLEVDKEILEDYIHAKMQIEEVQTLEKKLTAFIRRNQKRCERYVWTNQLGMTVNILDINDDYLMNLVEYLARQVRTDYNGDLKDKLSALREEAKKRQLTVSATKLFAGGASAQKPELEPDDGPINLGDIPF